MGYVSLLEFLLIPLGLLIVSVVLPSAYLRNSRTSGTLAAINVIGIIPLMLFHPLYWFLLWVVWSPWMIWVCSVVAYCLLAVISSALSHWSGFDPDGAEERKRRRAPSRNSLG